MLLTHLSLQRVGYRKTPRVPTNDERMRAFRAATPAQFGNAHFRFIEEIPVSGAEVEAIRQWVNAGSPQ